MRKTEKSGNRLLRQLKPLQSFFYNDFKSVKLFYLMGCSQSIGVVIVDSIVGQADFQTIRYAGGSTFN